MTWILLMFQTEINAWLQSFSVPWLDVFMQFVSFLGNGEIVAAILITLIMGVDLRKGLTILIAVLLASAVTNSLKNVFEMPRPVFLSSAVGEPGDSSSPPTFYDDGGGSTFWSLPKPEAIDKMRERYGDRAVISAAGMEAKTISRWNPFTGEPPPLLANRHQ